MNGNGLRDYVEGLQLVLARGYPTLSVREDRGKVVVEGVLQIKGADFWVESFLIEIEMAEALEAELPKVYEVGGRIPRDEAHHVNGDGSLCLGVPEQLWIEIAGRFEIAAFIEGPLRSFLLGASNMLRTGRWLYGERSHGGKGICEFYGEYIGTTEPRRVLDLLQVLQLDAPKDWRECPCGSERQLRRCHSRQVNELRSKKFPKAMIARSIKLVEEAMLIEQAGGDDRFRERVEDARDRQIRAAVRRALKLSD